MAVPLQPLLNLNQQRGAHSHAMLHLLWQTWVPFGLKQICAVQAIFAEVIRHGNDRSNKHDQCSQEGISLRAQSLWYR